MVVLQRSLVSKVAVSYQLLLRSQCIRILFFLIQVTYAEGFPADKDLYDDALCAEVTKLLPLTRL